MPHSLRNSATKTLAVIVPDHLSELVRKGESVPRYYNPGDFFDEVHIVMTNNDKPEPQALHPLVGRARLHLHNLPLPRSQALFAFLPGHRLPASFFRRALNLFQGIRPDLIRVHYGPLEGLLALYIKIILNIPYVISIHTVWDSDILYFNKLADVLYKKSLFGIHRKVLSGSDAVLCVYKEILRFANTFGARRCVLVYNSVSSNISVKNNYSYGKKAHIITVNRLIPGKNPENILRALRHFDCQYDIIGQGSLFHSLQHLVLELGLNDRVRFIPSMQNSELVANLASYDIAVFHCEYRGVSKGVLEASLAGMPIVANQHPGSPIPDYGGGWMIQCENTEDGYRQALGALLADAEMRRNLGRAARTHALAHWEPAAMEDAVAEIYAQLTMSNAPPRASVPSPLGRWGAS